MFQECHGFSTIHYSMIVRQRNVHHRPRHNFPGTDDRAVFNRVKPQYSALWRIYNRCREQGTIDPSIADREGTSLQFLYFEVALAGTFFKIDNLLFDVGKGQALS